MTMKASRDSYLDVLEQVCSKTVAVHARAVDREGIFPKESIAALGNAGLLGAVSAPEVGGLGLGSHGAVAIVERVAKECGSTGMVTCMHFAAATVLEAYASDDVRRSVAAGDSLSTLAFSETGSRSHFWAPTSLAKRQGSDAVLSANKSWITSAAEATIYVWSSRPIKGKGLSTLWLVPSRSHGLSLEDRFNGLGLRGNDSSPVTAVNVMVPMSAMLGKDGEGFDVMLRKILPLFCVCSAACSVGFMKAALEHTVRHISGTTYEHTNSKLADLPTIRNYVARMKIMVDSSCTLLRDTVTALEVGRGDVLLQIFEVKALAGEQSTQLLDLAMRVCGGAAFQKDGELERYFRDTRAVGVMGPTTDVLYDFIGKKVCGIEVFDDRRA